LQTIWQIENDTDESISADAIEHFLIFAREAGYQHIGAYIDQIIDASEFKDLSKFLTDFMDVEGGDKDAEGYDSLYILNTILSETVTYLKKQQD